MDFNCIFIRIEQVYSNDKAFHSFITEPRLLQCLDVIEVSISKRYSLLFSLGFLYSPVEIHLQEGSGSKNNGVVG